MVNDDVGQVAMSHSALFSSPAYRQTGTQQEESKPIFAVSKFLVNIVCNIGIMITFGAIFPPLAVVICLSILVNTRFVQLMIGRLLTKAENAGVSVYGHQLDLDCEGAHKAFRHVIWLLLVFTCLFYSLFVFDILGDAEGWRRALWAPLAMVSLPVVIYVGVVVMKLIYRCGDQQDAIVIDHKRDSAIGTNDEVRSSLIHTVSQGSEL